MNLNYHNMIGNDECDGLKNIKERKISSQAPKSFNMDFQSRYGEGSQAREESRRD